MGRFRKFLEALKPSEYRKYIKKGQKLDFKNLYNDFFKGKDRVYFPFQLNQASKKQVQQRVDRFLNNKKFKILDYQKGLAIEDKPEEEIEITDKQGQKRKVKKKPKVLRIGSILKDDPRLQKDYNEDDSRSGSRSGQGGYNIVISRHPYDIAGSSTDRGWTSCMNLDGGCMRQHVMNDVEEGTLVAYVIKSSDKNIKNPVSRVLIKPHENGRDQTILVADDVYGQDFSGLLQKVQNIVGTINKEQDDGIYSMNPNLYHDNGSIAAKTGDEVTKGTFGSIDDIESLPDSLLSSSEIVDMIDSDPEGYEIYQQNWEDFPDVLKDNGYFQDKYIEVNKQNYLEDNSSSDLSDWRDIPSIVRNSRDFAEEWIDAHEEVFEENDYDDFPEDIRDNIHDFDDRWIDYHPYVLDMSWDDFSKTPSYVENFIYHWLDNEDDEEGITNEEKYIKKPWSEIPKGLKQPIGKQYWIKNANKISDIPKEDLTDMDYGMVVLDVIKKHPEEKNQFFNVEWKNIPDVIKRVIGVEYWSKKLKDIDDMPTEKEGLNPYQQENISREYFKLHPKELEKYYNMSKDELLRQPKYIGSSLDSSEWASRQDWNDLPDNFKKHDSVLEKWISRRPDLLKGTYKDLVDKGVDGSYIIQNKWLDTNPEVLDKPLDKLSSELKKSHQFQNRWIKKNPITPENWDSLPEEFRKSWNFRGRYMDNHPLKDNKDYPWEK